MSLPLQCQLRCSGLSPYRRQATIVALCKCYANFHITISLLDKFCSQFVCMLYASVSNHLCNYSSMCSTQMDLQATQLRYTKQIRKNAENHHQFIDIMVNIRLAIVRPSCGTGRDKALRTQRLIPWNHSPHKNICMLSCETILLDTRLKSCTKLNCTN